MSATRLLLAALLLLPIPISVAQMSRSSWDKHVYQAIEERGKGNFELAAEHFRVAAEMKDSANFQQYWDAAIQYARAKKVDEAFCMLDKAIEAGMADAKRLQEKTRIENLHEDPRWDQAVEKMRLAEEAFMHSLSHPELRTELMRRWDNDQALVGQWDQQRVVIENNSRRLKEVIDQIGWPTISMVGKDGSWTAWAIAQHAYDIKFQRYCLSQIARALSNNEVEPDIYAELHDRIARNTYQQQLFGMATMEREGVEGFYPIQKEWNVNQRRRQIGLPPLEVFANMNHIDYKRPSKQEFESEEHLIRTEAMEYYDQALYALSNQSVSEAIDQFNLAMEKYGCLTNLQIFEFSARLAQTGSDDQAVVQKISELVRLLLDRQWDSIGLVLIDERFEMFRSRPGWNKLNIYIDLQ